MTRYDGLDAGALERLTGAPVVLLAATVPSTQDEVHRLAAAGAPSGAVVLADAQTGGRGRLGRAWHSPAGKGVWLSVLLRPGGRPLGGALAIRAGLAALAAVAEVAPAVEARIKWPNDLVIGGRKVGGILCEARWTATGPAWVAVGVGVNVAGPVDPRVRERATALGEIAPGTSRVALLGALVPRLRALEALPTLLTEAERHAFLRLHWPDPGAGETVDLEPDGALLVRAPDGTLDRRVSAS